MSLWTFLGSYHPVALVFGGLAIGVFAINFVQLMRAAARFCKRSAPLKETGDKHE